jgi:hypothetical protein
MYDTSVIIALLLLTKKAGIFLESKEIKEVHMNRGRLLYLLSLQALELKLAAA